MIIGVTGFFASGKDTVADYLGSHYGFLHLSLSDMIRNRLRAAGVPITIDSLTEMGNRIRGAEGPGALAGLAVAEMQPGRHYVVTSIRHPAEVATLSAHPPFCMLFVDAPVAMRYERSMRRGRVDDTMTFEQFVQAEQRQMTTQDSSAQNLAACRDMADHILSNEADLPALYGQVDAVVSHFCPQTPGAAREQE